MKLMKVILSTAVAFGVSTSFAQQKRKPAPKQATHRAAAAGGYGMAGCGLGSVVLGDQPGFIQIFAATLNTTGVQSFGLTTGTSNCGEGMKMGQVDQFIEVNKVTLENDMARGQGESLASLAQVLECKNDSFNSNVKEKYTSAKASAQQLSQEQLKEISVAACNI